ncbi:hypothetical protein NQ317_001177 [Molorchus minor]|uniref:Uncharacterized protein n=1 Tax=Molorchus minor TaxID=1323400 RepID=A0ABQ9J2X4_9CUCU|nr:hypothetical protein NQ317_001177 [Molorchus minor]
MVTKFTCDTGSENMDQLSSEKRLTCTYLLCLVVGAVTSITTGIAWGHWYKTLDQCIDRNCSCIIYGHHTATVFLGSYWWDVMSFITVDVDHKLLAYGSHLARYFYVFCCFGLTCFHGYRVLFTTKSPRTRMSRTALAKLEEGTFTLPLKPRGNLSNTGCIPTIHQPTAKGVLGIAYQYYPSFFGLYALVHFSIFLDGYYTTCNQYRMTLEALLSIHGSALPVLYHRLSCQGSLRFYGLHAYGLCQCVLRSGIINTALALILGIISSALSVVGFLHASILNIRLSIVRDSL